MKTKDTSLALLHAVGFPVGSHEATQGMNCLRDLYSEWREDRWRRCVDALNYRSHEWEIITLMYRGYRQGQIARTLGAGKNTITLIHRRLMAFLDEHPFCARPVCRCGKELWHRAICPEWDDYFQVATAKGRQRQAQLRAAGLYSSSARAARKPLKDREALMRRINCLEISSRAARRRSECERKRAEWLDRLSYRVHVLTFQVKKAKEARQIVRNASWKRKVKNFRKGVNFSLDTEDFYGRSRHQLRASTAPTPLDELLAKEGSGLDEDGVSLGSWLDGLPAAVALTARRVLSGDSVTREEIIALRAEALLILNKQAA